MATKDFSNHSIMYKSKSGNHLSISRQRLNGDLKKNRDDRRFAAFQRNRIVELSPKTQNENQSAAVTEDEGIGASISNEHISNKIKSNVSTQQRYKERFKTYLMNKQDRKNAKPQLKPFVSAVPSGKFLDAEKTKKTVAKKKVPVVKPERMVAVNEAIPICITPKHRSPINTRSKKLKLVPMMSMEQLTPKRKRRKAIARQNGVVPVKSNADNPRTVINVKRRSLNKDARLRVTNGLVQRTTSGAIKKTLNVAKPVNPTTSTNAPKIGKKPNDKTNVNSPQPSTSRDIQDFTRPIPSPLQKIKSPKIPKRFDFGPSSFGGVIASTAVKAKTANKPSSRTSKKIFNESISPIETVEANEAEAQPSSARRSKIQKTPKSITDSNVAFGKYVSPFVKISRKDATLEPSKTPMQPMNVSKVQESIKSPVEQLEERASNLNYVSPFVTIARGGRSISSHKEAEARQSKYSLSSRKSLDLNESVVDRRNKEAANYFRLQIDREVTHFTELIEKWSNLLEDNKTTHEIPDDYIDQIQVCIGQTRLLLRSKFKQFSGLIDECEHPKDKEIRPEDLEAFWSLVYIQVDNCNARFDKVEQLKANQWKDPELEIKQKKVIRGGGVKKPKQQPKRVNSALAEMLKAARKKFNDNKVAERDESSDVMILTKRKSLSVNGHLNNSKMRRSCTPNNTPWVVTDSVVGTSQTPAKSILKTPGSIRKQRLTQFKSSPEVKLFNKENDVDG